MEQKFKLYPLAATQPDWETFTKKIKEVTGQSPTEGLGCTIFDLKHPSAYLACLDLENYPMIHLRKGARTKSTFHHYSVSFLCFSEKSFLSDLCIQSSDLKIYFKEYPEVCISIITATMYIWYRVVVQNLSEHNSLLMRQFFHQVLYLFEQMGFKEVWSEYDRILLSDGTIYFKGG